MTSCFCHHSLFFAVIIFIYNSIFWCRSFFQIQRAVFQNSFVSFFCNLCPKIYSIRYLKQFSTNFLIWRLDIVQNVLIPCLLVISLHQNASICIYILGIYIGHIRTFSHKNYTRWLVIVQNLYQLWQFFLSDFFGSKCFNTLNSKNIPGGKMFQYPQVVYYWC